MLKPQGYATITVPDAPLVERDTCVCGHCQMVILVKPRTVNTVYLVPDPQHVFGPLKEVPGAGCRVCMRPVCLRCEAQGSCTPWERKLEQIEQRGRFLRSVLG